MLKGTFRSVAINTLKIFLFFCLTVFFPAGVVCQTGPFYPDDPLFFYNAAERPYFPGQWHLVNRAPSSIGFYVVSSGTTMQMINNGVDAGLLGAWSRGYTGRGVVIGIVDDGVDRSNYDIAPGYRADLSRNFSSNASLASAPQGPQVISDNHGTAVAGVAAARGGNGIGGTGAAPYAQIAGLRINLGTATAADPAASEQDMLNAYYWQSGVNATTGAIQGAPQIQVKNNSYSSTVPFAGESANIILALDRTASNGVIHVFSAGNDRNEKLEDANKDSDHNRSSVLTVAALGSDGKYANYSSFGSSVFVTAPSNRNDFTGFQITTTDRTGADLGYNRYSATNPSGDKDDPFPDTSYTSSFGGTSSSAPLVSGIMALGKEANPEMEIRMAKHALVKTSTVVDAFDQSDSSFGGWRTNAAGNRFNPNYGFGNINAGAFVQMINNVAYVTEQTSVTKTAAFSAAIPDNNPAGVNRTITIAPAEAKQPLEGVEVGLTFTHAKRGDLSANITSPSGMVSKLLYSTNALDATHQDTKSVTNFSWTFLSNAFWGEGAAGDWVLNMADIAAGNTGTWLGYNVVFLMGEMVLLTPGIMTQSVDIKALSLTILNSATTYQIPAGRTFQVARNVMVDGGTLVVNGEITEKPGGFGNEFGLYSGKVGGSGTINASRGFYNIGGTVSPGNSIGTLSIIGDYYQEPRASLLIEVASPASKDVLAVAGKASLSGTLQTSWQGGATPAKGTVFGAILTATAGVWGQFSSLVTSITPTLVFTPRYDVPNQVYLVVERDYMNPALLSYLNTNQRAVSAMLSSVANTATGDLNTVLNAIDVLPAYGQVAGAYDQIAPRGSEAIFRMGVSSTIFQAGNISDRLSDIRRGVRGASLDGTFIRNSDFLREGRDRPVLIASAGPGLTGIPPSVSEEKWGIFIKGNAVSGSQRDTPDQMGYNFTSAGMTVGVDWRFTGNLAAGLFLGYTGSRANVDDYDSKVKMDEYTLGTYGTWYNKGLFVDWQASYGWADYTNTRRIVFPGIDRTATSKPAGRQLTLYGGTGYELSVNKWSLVPAASLQYIKLNLDSFTESGAGALDLSVNSQNTESLLGNIGGRIYYTFDTGKGLVTPFIHASYGYDFLGGSQTVTSRLAQGSSSFSIENPSPDRNFVLCGAGASMILQNSVSLNIGYNVQIGMDKYIAHSINGGLRMTF